MGYRYSLISKEITLISFEYCLANCKLILSMDPVYFLPFTVLSLSAVIPTYRAVQRGLLKYPEVLLLSDKLE